VLLEAVMGEWREFGEERDVDDGRAFGVDVPRFSIDRSRFAVEVTWNRRVCRLVNIERTDGQCAFQSIVRPFNVPWLKKLAQRMADAAPDAPPQSFFLWRWAKAAGIGIYNVMYATGGFLSELFGITRPRYAWVLREYEERQRRLREQEIEAANDVRVTQQTAEEPAGGDADRARPTAPEAADEADGPIQV
jgi:hypothetical protein